MDGSLARGNGIRYEIWISLYWRSSIDRHKIGHSAINRKISRGFERHYF